MASSAQSIEQAAARDSVEGKLYYLGQMNEPPTTYAYTPPTAGRTAICASIRSACVSSTAAR